MDDRNDNDSFLKRALRHFVTCFIVVALFLLAWAVLTALFHLGGGDTEEGGEDSAVVYVLPGAAEEI